MDKKLLIKSALEAREFAYTPYSHFKVGAALLTKDGEIIKGCNIENIGFSATNCAERTAFFKAVSEGKRDFAAIAIVGGIEGRAELSTYAMPCGVCRQVMLEFCDPDTFVVIVAKSEDDYKEFLLKDIIPEYFAPINQKLGV